jgi:putative transposase
MQRKAYNTDMSDTEWNQLRSRLPRAKWGGRPRTTDLREILNAIFYITKAGCQWRMLPHEFPPWQTVYTYFRNWQEDGTWEEIHDFLRRKLRRQDGRHGAASAAIIDSQSVKASEEARHTGYDAGKKIKGRKRHLLVDTLGLLIAVVIHSADIQDRDGAKILFKETPAQSRLELVWADGGYCGKLVGWVKKSMVGSLPS